MIQSSTIFRKAAHQVSCQINDEVAILHLQRELYFGLQGSGVHIWDALEQPRSVAELCDLVASEFEVSQADCQADVIQVLQKLQAEGLVDAEG
jgi:hypothetical protein